MGRKRRRRGVMPALVVVAVTALAVGLTACGGQDTSANGILSSFASALNDHDAKAAASYTDTPDAAQPVIQQMIDGLSAHSTDFSVEQVAPTGGGTATFSLSADWGFGKDRHWTYTTDGQLTKLSIGWRISWSPGAVVPGLAPGQTVHYVRTDAAPPRVLDRGNAPIMHEAQINVVKIDPAHTPDRGSTTSRLADAIKPVAPLITSESLQKQLADAHGKPVTAVSLRDADYAILKDQITSIPGVVVEQQPKLVTDNGMLSSPLLKGVGQYWQHTRDMTAGWAVEIDDPNGTPHRVAGFQGPPPPDTQTTMDMNIQMAAQRGVVAVGQPSAIVAVQASTGDILAVAQNNQAYQAGDVALGRDYSPGVIFQALVGAAQQPGKPCGSNITGAGRVVPNRTDGSGQTRPASDTGCNDAPSQIPPKEVAQKLGMGVKMNIPYVPATTGKLDSDGNVTATPFGMAIAAATIARGGSVPTPSFIRGKAGAGSIEDAPQPLPRPVIDRMRGLMHQSVQSGALTMLQQYPGVDALFGQATVPGDPHPPSWMIGIRGDVAFAIFVGATDSTDNAVIVANQFLSPAPQ